MNERTTVTSITSNSTSQERLGSLLDLLYVLGILFGLVLGIINELLSAYALSVAAPLWFSTFALLTCADVGCVFLPVVVRARFDSQQFTSLAVAVIAIALCAFWLINVILSFNYGAYLWGLA